MKRKPPPSTDGIYILLAISTVFPWLVWAIINAPTLSAAGL